MGAFPYELIARTLGEFVPLVGRWISGSKGEERAKKIVEVAQKVTGHKDKDSIVSALKNDTKLLAEFEMAVLRIAHQMDMAELNDRQNARNRDIAMASAGRMNLRADIMVVSAAFGLVACLGTITFLRGSLPGEAVGIISTVAGIFGSCLKDAYAFEFGSSRGSKLKDTKIAELLGSHQGYDK